MKRVDRRRGGPAGAVFAVVEPVVMTVDEALELNRCMEIEDAGSALYEIRANCGPDQRVELCMTVTVLE